MMIVPIVYFSSSNNTRYVAEIVARGLEGPDLEPDLVRVEDVGEGRYALSGAGIVGVGAPIYGGFAEPIMRWASGFDFSAKKVFLFSTASKLHMGSTAQMIDVVRRRGGTVIGALEMKFPGTLEGIFYSPGEAARHPLQRADLERALRFGRDIAAIVKKGEGYADYTYRHRIGATVMPAARAIKKVIATFVKRALFESSCAGCTGKSCGACARVCPVDAIRLKEGCAEIDKDKCIACFRCFKECPSGTFSVRFAKDKEYYRGPWQLKGYVEPDELAKSTPT